MPDTPTPDPVLVELAVRSCGWPGELEPHSLAGAGLPALTGTGRRSCGGFIAIPDARRARSRKANGCSAATSAPRYVV